MRCVNSHEAVLLSPTFSGPRCHPMLPPNVTRCHKVKGNLSGPIFTVDVHTAFRDVDIDINKIAGRTGGEANLISETAYNVVCFAEDDWQTQARSKGNLMYPKLFFQI